MIDHSNLIPGQKVYFTNDKQPMEIIARSNRYAVCVRNLDLEDDYELIFHEVERGAYPDCETAFEEIKSLPIYSLLDFVEKRRGPSNMIFGIYDYFSKEDCIQCIKDLELGDHKISSRYGIELKIDYERTKQF